MAIDWITVTAQIINFLVLVWLLKHFLYQPVIRAMDRREQRIADRLNEAQKREQQADTNAIHYQEKAAELDKKRDEIIAKAQEQARHHKIQLLDEARAEITAIRTNWQRQAIQEKEDFLNNLRHRTAEAIQVIARKALADLAGADMEKQIIHAFINQLQSLDQLTRKTMADTSEPIHIISAFELDSAVRSQLTQAVQEHLTDECDIRYSVSADLLCGIELTSGGRRLSWNLADYMDDLYARIDEAFTPTEPANKSE